MSTKQTMREGCGVELLPSVAIFDAEGDIGGGPALIAMVRDCVAYLTRHAWECGAKAGKQAKRKQWDKTLNLVMAGNRAEQSAARYVKAARGLALEADRQRSKLRNGKTGAALRCGGKTPGTEAMKKLDALVAECGRLAEETKREFEPCDSLPVLEGMARLNLGRPIPRKGANRKHGGSERAIGQRRAKKAGHQ